jgi:hypothetical protein
VFVHCTIMMRQAYLLNIGGQDLMEGRFDVKYWHERLAYGRVGQDG